MEADLCFKSNAVILSETQKLKSLNEIFLSIEIFVAGFSAALESIVDSGHLYGPLADDSGIHG